MDNGKELIGTIQQVMQDKGLKQQALASELGCSTMQVSYMLHNRKELKAEYIVPICKVLGITPNQLFKRSLESYKKEAGIDESDE